MKKLSLFALIISLLFISTYRLNNLHLDREIAWDILGYYLPLPATFVHDDPLLNDISWLKQLNEERHLAGTLYMVTTNDQGEPMYFFFLGMSFFYFPFFIVAHIVANMGAWPADGFSPPYQLALIFGALFYTIIGLVFLRKILLKYFTDKTVAIILLSIVFGSNYIHHFTHSNLETIPVIFMFVNIIIWFTIRWHEQQKTKYLIYIVVSITLLGMVKPSEIIITLIPLLWNVDSKHAFKEKLLLIKKNKKQFFIAIPIAILIASPQMIYWYIKTGHFIYDSYKNPGVGLDIWSPHILNVLFSFRKGWLLYTPIMILFLAGFVFLYKKNKKIFPALFSYFLLAFYIISSWTEWWYGAGFSNRPLIATYPVLAIGFGYLLEDLWTRKKIIQISFLSLMGILIALNQFQWWQFKEYLIDPYRTTKDSYLAVFLKTKSPENFDDLLLIKRDFSGKMQFTDKDKYVSRVLFYEDFETDTIDKHYLIDSNNTCYHISKNQEFALTYHWPFKSLTKKDHVWLEVRFKYRSADTLVRPFLVMTMSRKGGNYHYFAFVPATTSDSNKWVQNEFEYLTPEIRNTKDEFLIYFWNRDKCEFDIDDIEIKVYEKREQ